MKKTTKKLDKGQDLNPRTPEYKADDTNKVRQKSWISVDEDSLSVESSVEASRYHLLLLAIFLSRILAYNNS